MALALPALCIVTRARGASGSPERARLLERLTAGCRAGATMVQIRERQLDDRQLLGFIADVRAAAAGTRARVLVNDRTDLALAAGADGVHLKSDAPPAPEIRTIVPEGFLIGRSVHGRAEAEATVLAGGCDYLLFGTVFPSRSKPDDHPIAGLEALRDVCRHVTLPVLAIGGITEARAVEAAAAGAAGVAAISLFAEARDVATVVSNLRRALTPSEGSV
jgi:thiamine-phosphate pyrophosphorylase